LICRLAPTCSGPNRATRLRDAVEMERHYAVCHTHICAADRCHTVFPDERFLELHQVECHDTLAAIRKERGEKIV
ncbi:uncharacterized protein EI90DRAFT_2877101, partial [Cantharellus anzutake]|uniref:uncharacterized protein n=1 Tax=Cantharellus anzutake TaxID=1750568 RepID=UPI00190338DE